MSRRFSGSIGSDALSCFLHSASEERSALFLPLPDLSSVIGGVGLWTNTCKGPLFPAEEEGPS